MAKHGCHGNFSGELEWHLGLELWGLGIPDCCKSDICLCVVMCVFCEMIKLKYVLLRTGVTGRNLCKSGRELQGWFIMCVRGWAIALWCCKALQTSYGSTHCAAAATGESSSDSKFQVALLLTRDKRLLLLLFWSWMRLLCNNML